MEKIFNITSIVVFIAILICLFYLLINKENKKYIYIIFFILIITLVIDLFLDLILINKYIHLLFIVLFIITILFLFKNIKLINNEHILSLLIKLFFIYYIILIFKTAWVSDDAFITFRVADNFINGYGLRFNIEERVQAYTNTLFLFIFIPFYFILKDAYFTALFLNFLFALLSILLFKKMITEKEKFLFVISGLCFSKAYIDFSTSGLENSLIFFLLILFIYIYLKNIDLNKKTFYLFLIFSFIFLNRADSILIVLPLLFLYFIKESRNLKYALLGLIPVILWEIFSIIYYGFPLPNTFYAKLNTGINRLDLIREGGLYFLNSLMIDPITLFIIFSSIFITFINFMTKNKTKLVYLTMGIILYLIYVLFIGGDFMSGRFFACCVPVALLILANLIKEYKTSVTFLIIFIFLFLISPFYTIYNLKVDNKIVVENPVQRVSEKEFYYPVSGLLNILSSGKKILDNSGYAKDALRIKNSNIQGKKVGIAAAIGMFGYFAGPDVYIIDQVSLIDAFAVRLPVTKRWRIGHFARQWPEGYEETLRQGKNLIKDEKLAKLYDKISIVTKGPIFSKERFKTILELNFKKGI
jgi:arabinofuranosyltransferase